MTSVKVCGIIGTLKEYRAKMSGYCLRIISLNDFTWRLEGNGEVLAQGRIDNVDLPAQQTGVFRTRCV